jgi:dihydroceramidase
VPTMDESMADSMVASFWGPVTSTMELCEENYARSSYIAEFDNTLSNAPCILLALIGLVNALRQRFEKRFSVLHISTSFTRRCGRRRASCAAIEGGWPLLLPPAGHDQALDQYRLPRELLCTFWTLRSGSPRAPLLTRHNNLERRRLWENYSGHGRSPTLCYQSWLIFLAFLVPSRWSSRKKFR